MTLGELLPVIYDGCMIKIYTDHLIGQYAGTDNVPDDFRKRRVIVVYAQREDTMLITISKHGY